MCCEVYTYVHMYILRDNPPFTVFGKKRHKIENTYYRCLREEMEKMHIEKWHP